MPTQLGAVQLAFHAPANRGSRVGKETTLLADLAHERGLCFITGVAVVPEISQTVLVLKDVLLQGVATRYALVTLVIDRGEVFAGGTGCLLLPNLIIKELGLISGEVGRFEAWLI